MKLFRALIAAVALATVMACTIGGDPTASAAPLRPVVAVASTPSGDGYWIVRNDGAVFTFGDATFAGSLVGRPLNGPILGIAPTPSGQGYWLIGQDGGIFSFGDAAFFGSTGGLRLNAPILAMMPTPTGKGYWLLASDGGIFSFGDAAFFGSTGGLRLNAPVIGGAATPTGRGYWLVAADGGVFSFGDAQFFGSTGSLRLNQPIVAMSSDPSGRGYRFVASDGGVFNFGAPSFGSGVGRVNDVVVAMAARPQGDGYWLTTSSGDVVALGAASALGSIDADLDALRVSVNPAFTGLDAPTEMVIKPGTRDMYVTEKAGRVRVIRNGVLDPTAVLTIDPSIITTAGERGLLSMAFNADGSRVYLLRTAADGDVMVEEYMTTAVSFVGASRRTVLTAEHSTYPNHNGGHLAWGPDGRLWISIGDGGGAGDPLGNGQNTATFLGKVLRIDPVASGAAPYTIPADNPFVGQAGKAPEVVAYGLRNPWRFSFDRATGDLWIADVGQGAREEIDLDLAPLDLGTNYGWPLFEGSQRYAGSNPAGAALPIFDYRHDNGDCSITGGVVYRGTSMPKADGVYFYGDFCTGRIGALRQRAGVAVDNVDRVATISGVVSFAQGVDDALYAVSTSGTIWRLTVG